MHSRFPEPHRGPWTEEECREWIRETEEEDRWERGVFFVARRLVGEWIPA